MSSDGESCAKCTKTGQNTELKSCGRCMAVSYCSQECQRQHWKTHKVNCTTKVVSTTAPDSGQQLDPPRQQNCKVATIPGKGRGLLATRKLLKGTRILTESPILIVPRDSSAPDALEAAIRRNLETLSSDQRQAFFALHSMYTNEANSTLGIVRTNSLPLGAGATEGGLFLQASRINHACSNNAQNAWNSGTRKLTIHACDDIEEGEEICISYLENSENYISRQRNLKARFGFDCTCALCSLSPQERTQSDARINEIVRLDGIVGDGMSIVNTPLTCLHHVNAMLRLMEEEHITDARVPRAYYDALQIAIAHSDQARAKVFAQRAYDGRVALEGQDGQEPRRLKGLEEHPSTHRLYGTTSKWKNGLQKVPKNMRVADFEAWLWRKKVLL